ncbi:MAG: hypothetical protein NTY90_04380 [Candidatus Micrarchaeota archaeon]|nr:hypothetical protein [Candidatus Micrarchaeota archaeon]
MDVSALEDIGLSAAEARTYLALLELGSTTTGAVIRKSGLYSSVVYHSLQKLVRRGLAAYVSKRGRRFFQAAEPGRLVDYAEEKRRRIEEALPELEAKKAEYVEEMAVYEGLKGFGTVFDGLLAEMKAGEEHLVSGIPSNLPEVEAFFRRFWKKRARRGVRVRALFNESARPAGRSRAKIPLSRVRYMPEGMVTPAAIAVFHDKTVIMATQKRPFKCFVIKSRDVADSFTAQFEYMWGIARK